MNTFPIYNFRQQFPILEQTVNGCPLVYFDNAATMQKPNQVIECNKSYYEKSNANVHRASHALSTQATTAYENTRQRVKTLINAQFCQEIIWSKGTTESINLVAQSWGSANLKYDDEIVLSYSEHHANIVPWQIIAEKTGAKIKVLPLTPQGVIDTSRLAEFIGEKTRIVCCAHISNVLGRVNPIEEVINFAKKFQAVTLIDGAQAIAHLAVDVNSLDCDFYVFSAHKMYGPNGVGVLYGKYEILEQMPPYQAGGEMIKAVSFNHTTFNELPHKFEAGTPNVAGIVAFGSAVDFIKNEKINELNRYEQSLTQYCFEQLSQVQGLNFLVAGLPDIPLFSFTIEGHHNQDVAATLDSVGIAVRAGHHCAMPLMQYFKIDGCIRLSLAAYNTIEEIDKAILVLKQITAVDTNPTNKLAKSATTKQKPYNDEKALNVDEILKLFKHAKSWDSKHREIMMLGKNQSRLAEEFKNEQSLISGCESQAWLVSTFEKQPQKPGVFKFNGDSDAKVIRGLLAIVLAAVNNKTREEVLSFDMKAYFNKLGLLQHLSPSRGNGLMAIVNKINAIVET